MTDIYFARGSWLMERDEDGATYVQIYRAPADAARAARDLNANGRASSPAEYARLRMAHR